MHDIRVDLTLPVLSFGFGPFQFDPLTKFLGCPFEELVESLLVAPPFRRAGPSGGQIDVYPLALPDGEGASVPLGSFGHAAFNNVRGLLVLGVVLGVLRGLGPARQHHQRVARIDHAVQAGAGEVRCAHGQNLSGINSPTNGS